MFMYVYVWAQACEGQRLTLCVFLNCSPLIYSYLWGKTLSEPRSCQLSRTGWPGIPRDSHRISMVPTELLARLRCSIFTEEGIQTQRGHMTQSWTSNSTWTNGTFNLVYLERVGKEKEKLCRLYEMLSSLESLQVSVFNSLLSKDRDTILFSYKQAKSYNVEDWSLKHWVFLGHIVTNV